MGGRDWGDPASEKSLSYCGIEQLLFRHFEKTITLGVILGIGLKHPKHQTGNETIGQFAAIDPVRIAADG
jgi:hypothetical protein